MNPLTNTKNIQKLNQRELQLGTVNKKSWHDEYKDSAWVFIGGLPYNLTEGDIICVFSQYGEIVNINLVRDKTTGKSKGYAFLCYEDQRSTVLAVDNLNSIKLLGRIIRVDHVADYKRPKDEADEGDLSLSVPADVSPSTTTQPPLLSQHSTSCPPPTDEKVKRGNKKKKHKSQHKHISVRQADSSGDDASGVSDGDNLDRRRCRKSKKH